MSELIGKTLGPYQVLLKIRSTHTNTLYKAYDSKLGRNVALQVILPGQSRPATLLPKLKAYAKILAQLSHPNIGVLLDCEQYGDEICLAYDFVPHGILRRRFQQKLEWAKAARRLISAAQALTYAHKRGVLHGHIRPSTIILNEDGAPVLFDFGVELLIAQEVYAHNPGNWIGSETSCYTAPEQVLGKKFDHRADIYAFGMVLFEQVTGRRAYQGETAWEEILNQCTAKPGDVKESAAKLAGAKMAGANLAEIGRQILEKALHPAPDQRFQEMQHFTTLLAKIALNQPVHPKMIATPTWVPPKPLNPRLVIGGALFLITFISLAVYLALTLPATLAERQAQTLFTPTGPATVVAAEVSTQEPTPKATATPRSPTRTARPTNAPTQRAAAQGQLALPALFNTPVPQASNPITVSSAPRLLTLSRLGIGWLNDAAWSKDGGQVALATTTGVYGFDPATRQMAFYINTAGSVTCLAFSPDGARIATGDQDGLVRVWDTASGRELASLSGHLLPIRRVAFSPDGRLLGSVSDDKTARLWDTTEDRLIGALAGHVQGVTGLAFAPDGSTLVTSSLDFNLKLWNTSDGSLLNTFIGHSPIHDVTYTPDGKFIITGDGSSSISQWDTAAGKVVETIGRLSMAATEVEISPDGKLVAAADTNGQISLFDMYKTRLWSAKNEGLPRAGTTGVYYHRIAFSPDSAQLASAIWDNTVRFYNTANGSEAAVINQFSDFITTLEISPDNRYLAGQTTGGQVKVWDLRSAKLLHQFPGSLVNGRVFSYDSKTLAVKASAGSIKLYMISDGQEIYTFNNHGDLRAVSFSQDGSFLATGGNGEFHIWSLHSGQEVITEKNFGLGGCTIAYSLSGSHIAYATRFNYVDFMDRTNTNLCTLIKVGWMQSMVYRRDSPWAAAGGASKLEVWNYKQGDSTKKDMQGLFGFSVNQVALSPNAELVAGAVSDLSIRVYNAATGEEVVRIMGHQAPVSSMTFTHDGKYLIVSSMDGTIRIWGIR